MYDLEKRLFEFNKSIQRLTSALPQNKTNEVYLGQLVRSASSIGANYIEANEAVSKKDFRYRIFISRKEAKETSYWLNLLLEFNPSNQDELGENIDEVVQLRKILAAIYNKSK